MKKLAVMVLVALFVSATSASAWWIFGKKAADGPAKQETAACSAKSSKCCAKMTDEAKAAKCASMSEEDKAKCEAKKARCEEKKAKKTDKQAKCEAKKAEKKAQKEAKKAEKAQHKAEKKAKKAEKAEEASGEVAPAEE